MADGGGVVTDEQPLFFDPDGNPIDAETWAGFAGSGVRFVGVDQVGPLVVSTVWLGIDALGRVPPLIFETLVFEQSDTKVPTPLGEFTRRYATAADARTGHLKTVLRVQLAQDHQ